MDNGLDQFAPLCLHFDVSSCHCAHRKIRNNILNSNVCGNAHNTHVLNVCRQQYTTV